MSCCYELFKLFSVFIVGAQILFGVSRWLYANVIGPHLLGPINLRQYGKWACKFFLIFEAIDYKPQHTVEFQLGVHDNKLRKFCFYSGDWCNGWYWKGVCEISKTKTIQFKITAI